jgi:hypothetical protein
VSNPRSQFSGLTRSREVAKQPEDVEAVEGEPREEFDLGDDFAGDVSECEGYTSPVDLFS